MEINCPSTLAFGAWIDSLADSLQSAPSDFLETPVEELLATSGIDLSQCDQAQLLMLVRERLTSLTDDQLLAIAGGEKFGAKIATALIVPVAVGLGAGAVAGGIAGGAASGAYIAER